MGMWDEGLAVSSSLSYSLYCLFSLNTIQSTSSIYGRRGLRCVSSPALLFYSPPHSNALRLTATVLGS